MKTVYLHGRMGDRFGKKWQLNVKNLQEAIVAIDVNKEGFLKYIIEKDLSNTPYIILNKNPQDIKSQKDFDDNFIHQEEYAVDSSWSEIHIIPATQGSGLITAITVAFKAVAAYVGKSLLAKIALTALVGFAMQALMKPPKPPARKDPVTTKSFLMTGARTRQAQGIAVPLGYGRLKIGATNVATRKVSKKLTDSRKANTLESYTEMEFIDLLSEGPIHGLVNQFGASVSSSNITEAIYINDVPVKNTPKELNSGGSFNFVLNENQDNNYGRPSIKLGEDIENNILSDGVFYIKNYDTLIYGPPPYGKTRYSISEAKNNDAKIVSHFVSNPDVNEITFSFKAELSKQTDEGEIFPNSLGFAILVSRGGEDYNVLEPLTSGCEVLSVGAGVSKVANFDGLREAILNDPGWSSGYERFFTKAFSIGAIGLGALADWFFGYPTEIMSAGTGLTGLLVNMAIVKKAKDRAQFFAKIDDAHFSLYGIATSTYQFDIKLKINRAYDLADAGKGLTFKVVRLSAEYDPSVKGGDFGGISKSARIQLAHVEEKISENLIYPHTAMARVVVDSKNFSNVPDRSYHVKLKRVLIPQNYDPDSRTYLGPWNGLFKGQSDGSESIHSIADENKYWTDNPAWVFFDLLHNARYGVGKYGLEEENIDKWQLYKIAKYCDELVETDYPVETSTGNPRQFTCNNQLSRNIVSSGSMEVRIVDQEMSSELFSAEFGDGNSYAGKHIAFFMHQSNGDLSDQEIMYRSSMREGEIRIERRTIVRSDPESLTVIVSGPRFENNGSSTIGACAAEINHPIVEPRFSANLYLTDRAEAYEVIKNLASIFRGMSAYSNGKILAVQDSYKTPIQLFNNSNVSKEGFSYVGVQKNKKVSASLVRFNNEAKNFRPDLVYEEDSDAIQKFGYIENETMGMGITSESQARRLCRWILMTSQLETESVKFTAGQEASYLFPGAVFEVADEARSGKNKSGRVLDVGSSRDLKLNDQVFTYNDPYILLDKSIEDDPVLSIVELTVCVGTSNTTQEKLELRSPFERSKDDQDAEIEAVFTPQIYRFQASLGRADNIKRGPQGQRTVAYNLMLKIPFEVDIQENTVKKFEHNFQQGDRVVFHSEGILPGGLSKSDIYFVVNQTKHTFQVSLSDPEQGSFEPVNIMDHGKDYLLNEGGLHYFSMFSENSTVDQVTQDAINQISVGCSYSVKGLIGVSGGQQLSEENVVQNLQIKNDTSSGWVDSKIFGNILIEGNDGWAFSTQLNEWIYLKYIIDYGISQNAWFFGNKIGWVWINQVGESYFWYIENIDEWVFAKKESQFFYRYLSDVSDVSTGDIVNLLNKNIFVKNKIENNGYYFSFVEVSNEYQDGVPPEILNDNILIENPGARSSVISDIFYVSANDSVQGKECIRISLNEGHGLNIKKNNLINISSFNSDSLDLNQEMNKQKISTIYINPNTVELVYSDVAASLIGSANIVANGSISFVESAVTEVERKLDAQLFRTLSVKELSENQYEVNGLEYNSSKFNAVDKKGVVKRPHLPIPPQADMKIPDAPTNLVLNDLTL